MSNHNVNAKELIEAIDIANNRNQWGFFNNPVMRDFATLHPTKFITSVEKHSGVTIKESSKKDVHVCVVLKDISSKICAVKLVRELTGLGLGEAKLAVESGCFKLYNDRSPNVSKVSKNMTTREAEKFVKELKEYWNNLYSVRECPEFKIVNS